MATVRDFKVDPTTGDLVIGADIEMVSDGEAIAQACRIHLQWFLGEWFLDEEEGFPWFEQVLVKNPDFVAVRELVRSYLLEVTGVRDVTSLDLRFDPAERVATIGFTVSTDFGEFSGSVSAPGVS